MSDEPKLWPQGGYAPGGYMCKCSTCGQTHQADKRAWQCADCVIQRLAKNADALRADLAAARARVAELSRIAASLHDSAEAAEAERDAALAMVAAALQELRLQAADIATKCVYQYADPYPPIMALGDPDAKAALDRLLDAARAEERERLAQMVESTAYVNNGDVRALEPVRPGLRGMDMHHATIAAAIREART